MTDYYDILKIASNASQKDVRQAYRKLIVTMHPDKNVTTDRASFAQITEAYEILGNTKKRAEYDRIRATMLLNPSKKQPRMTWMEGIRGFVTELKRELRNQP